MIQFLELVEFMEFAEFKTSYEECVSEAKENGVGLCRTEYQKE